MIKLPGITNPPSPKEELEKKILAAEREYKQGLTSLRDLIAPSAFVVSPNQADVSGKLTRSFFVISYPRFISVNWLSPLISLDQQMDMAMFIYPIDTEDIMKKLRNKVGQLQSTMAMNQERGQVRDPMLETAYQDVEALRDRLQQGTERYFRFSIYFTVYADSQKELDEISATMESILGSKLIIAKPAVLQMEQGFNSTLPLGNDELAIASNMNTEPLSTTFPFVSSELTSNDGILYGINRHNNSLILFDRFQMENANSVCFAKSGAGKSYAVKLEILRSLMLGTDVIVIDPENEYKHLSDAVGGSFLNISLNSNSRVNPFDLPRGIEGETNEDILRDAVINLLGLMNLMLGKLNPTEEAIMDRALWETYAKRDITPGSAFENAETPIMQDLVDVLGGMVGGESLAQRLTKYTEGTFSGIFNQPTNINLDNQFVVFSVRDLEDALRPIAIYVILNYLWNTVRSQLKKRILVIDEAWWMMQHDDSAKFLFGIAKRSRKYYLGVTTITQDVSDFLQSPYGKPIVTNSSIQLLFKQSPAAIDLIAETFFLTEGEKYLLLESDIGEGIFFAGLKHVAIKIIASYMEDQIITTDPKRALEIEQAKKEIQTERAAS
ncbi:MAG: conjugal transfer protein TraC [Candidatus Doudnabacteria bacterium RIFCSPHIGHO2_12_FULL_48_11]|uniref:Conjugal transfer protein TraC n=1 Tax=Candidatus Doudnabacteria bacterium RIFCSPHIGHO2_01_FULL_46_24 TaxID=1817825 RepID=A0A1F5NTD5_9BACT|nr:MAG: conjugal transfer protein TraC [Candidatus Doudnabacteria bacterium RIFCSPHIGHO2_01_FULL_46_24]OGE95725.1 MAG: conjugal transfer protein TraC [Candidatus Doudnabacteria bacterium RIFCSPHIGHO2_12_FULL_48_11]